MKKKFPLLTVTLGILLLAFISVLAIDYLTRNYRMELYLKQPDGKEVKLRECTSSSENFECIQPYSDCSESGEYFSKAITYQDNAVLSDSGWQPTYKC